ncbi:MAG: hypothetical protein HY320_00460 [Armatimonadetes bacterium]|nr:hypothetical protein [Armatimonadota bacterium]
MIDYTYRKTSKSVPALQRQSPPERCEMNLLPTIVAIVMAVLVAIFILRRGGG